jgi:membrane fusion protein (multidrug efflux system)
MRTGIIPVLAAVALVACSKSEHKAVDRGPVEVTAQNVVARDTPVTFEYVGQTQSSRQVQIVARVSGFLERRVYTEGSFVKAGQVMFQQDARPFQVQVDAAKAALAEQQARQNVADDNLARVKPLAERKALSQRELEDAIGAAASAAAAVEVAKANLEQAKLNLSYTTIVTPVSGLSSFSKVQDGQYVNVVDSQLTYVAQLDPMWVNFSVSENDMLALRSDQQAGRLKLPPTGGFDVAVVLANGETFPTKGRITFESADFNQQTGTFLFRATLANPEALLRPGQFVRVQVSGAVRPNAILVPQPSVLQGAQGHFVVVVDKENRAQIRPVEVGPWHGDDWFILKGLAPGDVVVTDGMVRVSPGAPVKVVAASAAGKGEAKAMPAAGKSEARAAPAAAPAK